MCWNSRPIFTCVYVLLYEGKCKWSYSPSCPVDFPLNIFIHSYTIHTTKLITYMLNSKTVSRPLLDFARVLRRFPMAPFAWILSLSLLSVSLFLRLLDDNVVSDEVISSDTLICISCAIKASKLIIIIVIIYSYQKNAYKINKHINIVCRNKGQLRTRSLTNNNSSKSNTEALCCVEICELT